MPKILIGVQARTFSQRLPEKVYAQIGDKSMLEHVVANCRVAEKKNCEVMVLGPEIDLKLEAYCKEKGFPFFGGDHEDLIHRYIKAMDHTQATHAIRITADCPFIEPKVISMAIEAMETCDYACNTTVRSMPEGYDIQAASKKAWLWLNEHQKEGREHPFADLDADICVQKKFMEDGLKVRLIWDQGNVIFKKLSVDTKEDLQNANMYWRVRGSVSK